MVAESAPKSGLPFQFSELKPLGNQRDVRPGVLGRAPWLSLRANCLPSLPNRLEENRNGRLIISGDLMCVIRRSSTRVLQPWSSLTLHPCVSASRNTHAPDARWRNRGSKGQGLQKLLATFLGGPLCGGAKTRRDAPLNTRGAGPLAYFRKEQFGSA